MSIPLTIAEYSLSHTLLYYRINSPASQDFSVNLKAPVVINMDNRKGVQMIVEDDYPVKYKVYDVLKAKKEKAGE